MSRLDKVKYGSIIIKYSLETFILGPEERKCGIRTYRLNGVQFKDLFFQIYAQTIIRDSAMIAVLQTVSSSNQYRKGIKTSKCFVTY